MKRKQFTEEQIIGILKEAEAGAPASNAEPHLALLNSLIGHNKEKLHSAKSESRETPLWSKFSVSHSDT